jgi:hypothetical protein
MVIQSIQLLLLALGILRIQHVHMSPCHIAHKVREVHSFGISNRSCGFQQTNSYAGAQNTKWCKLKHELELVEI